MAARDFIFIDESGEPGSETPYYVQGLIHVTDESLRELNIHLGAFRYFGIIKKEFISTRLNQQQKERLLAILKLANNDESFVRASAVFVNKEEYSGPYLQEQTAFPRNPTKFRHLIIRKLLEFHFQNNYPQSREIEIIIDRFHSDEIKEQQLRNYLRKGAVPNFLHIIQADSRYVEMLQIADWVSGSVKERFFTHPERDYENLFEYIKVAQAEH